MNKRDLKADLEKIRKINELAPEPTGDFVRDVVLPHALHRAIAAEQEVERLRGLINTATNTLKWYAHEESYRQEWVPLSETHFDGYYEVAEIMEEKGARARAAIQRIQEGMEHE